MSKVSLVVIAIADFYATNGAPRASFETHTPGPSMARQEFADECDINKVMLKYQPGTWPPVPNGVEPRYVDFTALPSDLMGTMELVHAADAAFMSLPAAVRREFENDPLEFADYAADPANLEQMRAWGLAKPEPVEAFSPVPAPGVPPGPPVPPAAVSVAPEAPKKPT